MVRHRLWYFNRVGFVNRYFNFVWDWFFHWDWDVLFYGDWVGFRYVNGVRSVNWNLDLVRHLLLNGVGLWDWHFHFYWVGYSLFDDVRLGYWYL